MTLRLAIGWWRAAAREVAEVAAPGGRIGGGLLIRGARIILR